MPAVVLDNDPELALRPAAPSMQARAEAALAQELSAADTPLALRLLLNDAGTYDAATKTGGCDGSIVLP